MDVERQVPRKGRAEIMEDEIVSRDDRYKCEGKVESTEGEEEE